MPVIDACLAREGGIDVTCTNRPLARRVGHLLVAAGWGSEHQVDATVISVGAAAGGGLVLTGDLTDLSTLAPAGSGIVARGFTDG